MRFSEQGTKYIRQGLMKRGRNLAELLAEVMAGKQPPQLAALLAERPGERPEEVLRRALDQNETQRKLLDAGDERFGRCDVCGEELGEAALIEVPWADRCPKHATA